MKTLFVCSGVTLLATVWVANAQYNPWTNFTTANRLAGNSIREIIEDREGNLWFGTNAGVSKYDRRNWSNLPLPSDLGTVVNAMIETSAGNLLVGTDRGAAQYDKKNNNWTVLNGLPGNVVFDIVETDDGTIDFATNMGVGRYKNGIWLTPFTTETITGGIPNNGVWTTFKDREGAIWFGTGGGAAKLMNNTWTHYDTSENKLVENNVYAILEDHTGNFWFGTNGGVSQLKKNDGWTSYKAGVGGLVDNYVHTIIEDSEHNLWFGTNSWVSRFDGKNWENFTNTNGLTDNQFRAILEDSEGTLWFGTGGGGVDRYTGNSWRTFTTDDGLGKNGVWAIVQDRHDSLWFGTDAGLSVFNDNDKRWGTHLFSNEFQNRVYAILEDSTTDELWIGTRGGVGRKKGDSWTFYTRTADGLASDTVNTIFKDRQGVLWFGTFGGISLFRNERIEPFTPINSLSSKDVRAIYQDIEGAMWLGTNAGAVRYQGDSLRIFAEADNLAGNIVNAIVEDNNRVLWFGTNGGASRWDGKNFQNFRTTNELGNNWILAIFKDRRGNVWFGTQGGGVSRYDGTSWTTLTKGDGLATNFVHSILEDHKGNFWFGTSNGGVSRFRIDGIPPRIFITAGPTATISDFPIIFSFEGRDNLTRPEDLHFSYAVLNGSNDPAIDWTGFDLNTSAVIGHLPDGNYTFQVKAKDKLGNISSTAMRSLTVRNNAFINAQITSPESNSFLKDQVKVIGTANASDFMSYQLSIDNSDFDTVSTVPVHNNVLATWETLGFADGKYTIRLRVETGGGNVALTSVDVSVDNTSPRAVIDSLVSDSGAKRSHRGKVIIYGTARDDNFDFYQLEYREKGRERGWRHIRDTTKQQVENGVLGVWDTASLTLNGEYELIFRAVDKAGLSADTTLVVVLTNDAPDAAILSPPDNDFVTGAVPIIGNALGADFRGYELYFQSVSDPTDSGTIAMSSDLVKGDLLGTWSTNGRNGRYALMLTVFGSDSTRHTIHLNIDNVLPVAQILQPENVVLDSIVTIIGKAIDKNFKSASLDVGRGSPTSSNEWNSIVFTKEMRLVDSVWVQGEWNTFGRADGIYTLRLIVTDSAGLSNTMFRVVEVDNITVVANISLPRKINLRGKETVVTDTVRIDGTASDVSFKEYFLEYSKEYPINWQRISGSIKHEVRQGLLGEWATAIPGDTLNGRFMIRLTAVEEKGANMGANRDTVIVRVDNERPIAQITWPDSGYDVGGVVGIVGTAADANLKEFYFDWRKAAVSSNQNVWTRINNTSQTSNKRNEILDTWNAKVDTCLYDLRLSVIDEAGFVSRDAVTIHIVPQTSREAGARIVSSDGLVELYLPPRAIPENEPATITINPLPPNEHSFLSISQPLSRIYRIEPGELALRKPARLTFLERALINEDANRTKDIVIGQLLVSEKDTTWSTIGGTFEESAQRISTAITEFGEFALTSGFRFNTDVALSEVRIQPRVFSPRGQTRPQADVSFTLGKASGVTIKIFNTSGRLVCTLTEGVLMNAGTNVVSWNGRDSSDRDCLNGVYVVVIQTENIVESKTVVVNN